MLRFQNGEESCFKELVDHNSQRVYAVVYRLMGSVEDSEDIAQEVFLRVYRAKNNFKPTAKFTTWLFTICRNTCLKRLQKGKLNTVSLSEQTPGEHPDESPREIKDSRTPSPLEAALAQERAIAIKQAINRLPESQRTALILARFEQQSYEEIATVMSLSSKAVKSLLHRARVNLKESLQEYL